MPSSIPYCELPGLETFYLEDSYVLAIDETPDKFTINLDCVLTEEDTDYHPPKLDEQYCYKKLAITFDAPRHVDWLKKSFNWTTDASGERDLGNIDTFEKLEDGTFELSGSWGTVRIHADTVSVLR